MRRYVRQQLRRRLDRTGAALQAVRNSGDESEALHDLRVSVRRLQQALRLFEDFLDRDRCKEIRRKLSRLMDLCGAVRNCDVSLVLLAEVGITGKRLLLNLRQERARRRERLLDHLRKWDGQTFSTEWYGRLKPRGAGWKARKARAALLKLARKFFAAGASSSATEDLHQLHQFRLLGKRFRYSMEVLETLYGDSLQGILTEMRRLQDRLGAVNDCVTALQLSEGHTGAQRTITRLLARRAAAFRSYWKTLSQEQDAWEHVLKGL